MLNNVLFNNGEIEYAVETEHAVLSEHAVLIEHAVSIQHTMVVVDKVCILIICQKNKIFL